MPKPESSTGSFDESICLDLSQDQKYWLWEREEIRPATANILATLPLDAYPLATARDYAHVLNVLAEHWDDTAKFVEAAGNFLRSREWKQEGFPRVVFFEIMQIVACHGSLAHLGVLDLRRLNLKAG
jgi:hypothetical protein